MLNDPALKKSRKEIIFTLKNFFMGLTPVDKLNIRWENINYNCCIKIKQQWKNATNKKSLQKMIKWDY